MEDQSKIDANLFQLIVSLQMAAMQNLGKIASPVTGEIERNMEQAKISIDMLEMLAEKTKGNLTDEEYGLLDRTLYELRMNYVDESKKEEGGEETSKDYKDFENKNSERPNQTDQPADE
jgi:hypothetical protein